jgi:16S rRNA processing protein RimM
VGAHEAKWVTLGRVSGVFGVKGWLKVQSFTDPRDNIVRFGAWTLRGRGAERAFDVEDGHSHAGGVVAKLKGLDDRDRAREWVGAHVVVPRAQLPRLREGELYWADLEGLEVRTTAGVVLGKVDHLLATGQHDVLVLDSEPERLIPFVRGAVVKDVDLSRAAIVVDWSPDY